MLCYYSLLIPFYATRKTVGAQAVTNSMVLNQHQCVQPKEGIKLGRYCNRGHRRLALHEVKPRDRCRGLSGKKHLKNAGESPISKRNKELGIYIEGKKGEEKKNTNK